MMQLEDASPEIKLAVDLIYILESNNIAPNIVLEALEIVKHDYQKKITLENTKQ